MMPTNMRNGAGGNGQNAQPRNGGRPQETPAGGEQKPVSPLVNMARRIRGEQGVSGLREFIRAMEPFAAPNELRSLANDFDLDYEALRQPPRSAAPNGGGGMNAPFGIDPQFFQIMQLMQLMNGMGMNSGARPHPNGGMNDPMQLMQLMRIMPLLNGAMNGGVPGGGGSFGGGMGGGPDLSALMRMMGNGPDPQNKG